MANLAFECYSKVRLLDIDKLTEADPDLDFRIELDRVCEQLSEKISTLSVKLTANYFSHTTYQSQGTKDNFKLEI